jgi:cytidine deaminase
MNRRNVLATIGFAAAKLMAQKPGLKSGEMREEALSELIPGIGTRARKVLLRVFNESRFDGMLSAEDVQAMSEFESKPVGKLMIDLLPLAAAFAAPAISNFHVGVLLQGISGRVYLGANIEIAKATLGATVHAEQCAAANAYMHREEGFSILAVTAAPCGLCRQFLWEMCYGRELQVMTRGHVPSLLRDLLPDAFGPKDLGLQKGALPVTHTALQLQDAKSDPLVAAALQAAQTSYAPYTKAYAGVALKMTDGKIYGGSYIENAAYNPSLSPLQVALTGLTVVGDRSTSITHAVLVEVPGKLVSHRSITQANLSTISPSATLTVLSAMEG